MVTNPDGDAIRPIFGAHPCRAGPPYRLLYTSIVKKTLNFRSRMGTRFGKSISEAHGKTPPTEELLRRGWTHRRDLHDLTHPQRPCYKESASVLIEAQAGAGLSPKERRESCVPRRGSRRPKMRSANGRQRKMTLACLVLICSLVLQASGNIPTRNLSNNPGSSLFPAIAVSEGQLYIVWDDDTLGNSEIFYVRSIDGGQTFSPPQNLSRTSGTSRNPAIAASGTDVYIVWDDDTSGNAEILYLVSRDKGATFSPAQNLSQNEGRSVLPEIAVSGQTLHIVWQDDTPGNREILYRRSRDSGGTFETIRNLSQNSGRSLSPAIVALGNQVYVAWDDTTPGNHEIFFIGSSDAGASFSAALNISNTPSFSAAPSLAALGSHVYLTWTEEFTTENYEVFYAQSSDGGRTFSSIQNISNSATYSGASILTVTEDAVHLIWIEGLRIERNGKTIVDYEALYTHASNAPGGFAQPRNLSASEGATVGPALVISGGQLVVAYADDTPGNFEVFLYEEALSTP
jgi:hypothetical protein